MTARDDETLNFYATEAEAYAGQELGPTRRRLTDFLAALPSGGRILELGCGSGRDSAAMLAQGFDVTPTDGSPELAREAEMRLGRPVQVLLFGDLDAEEHYDGIWANACLLHVPRADLPSIIGKIHAALKPGGVFHASYKAGATEGRDGFNRYFNYPSADWLREVYEVNPWQRLDIREGQGSGYDRLPTDWLYVTAVKGS